MDLRRHTDTSSYREKLIEHLFIGELLRHLWQRGVVNAEFIRPEVDSGGYDLVVECNSVLRHIQLKSSYRGAKTTRQKIHIQLSKKPSGCVVWIQFDPETLELGPYLWFGGEPGKPLRDIEHLPVAKHTKGDSTGSKGERPKIRVLNKGKFEKIPSIDVLATKLFGKLD